MNEALDARIQIAKALASGPPGPEGVAGLHNQVLSQLFRWWAFNEGWPRLAVADLRDLLHEDFEFHGPVALKGRAAFEARLSARDPQQRQAHVLRKAQVDSTADGGAHLSAAFDYIGPGPSGGLVRMPLAYEARFERDAQAPHFPRLRSLTPALTGEIEASVAPLSTYAEHRALATLYRHLALCEMDGVAGDWAGLFTPDAAVRLPAQAAASPAALRSWLQARLDQPRRARVAALTLRPLAADMGLEVAVDWIARPGGALRLTYQAQMRDDGGRFARIAGLRVAEGWGA